MGSGQTAWDGEDNSGSVLADGVYSLVVTFTDVCGNQIERELFVEIDNTAPAITIDFPITGDPLPQVVEVQGSIGDINIDDWQVEFGVGTDPQSWLLLNKEEGNREQEVLANWNTFGLTGPYTLRITASDSVGNVGVEPVLVTVDVSLNIISYFEAIENLFSPNADGQRDNTSIRFGLEEQAVVNLAIYDESDIVVRQLLLDEVLNSGPVVSAWNGLNDLGAPVLDGGYSVRCLRLWQVTH